MISAEFRGSKFEESGKEEEMSDDINEICANCRTKAGGHMEFRCTLTHAENVVHDACSIFAPQVAEASIQ